jgi:hypothetical protein
MVLVRSAKGWTEISVPEGSWSFDLQNLYGMLVARGLEKGLLEEKARSVAEVAVYKKLYPGLRYGKDLERLLENVCS